MKQNIKKIYEAPEILIADFTMEEGFAASYYITLEPLSDAGLEGLSDSYVQGGASTEGLNGGLTSSF